MNRTILQIKVLYDKMGGAEKKIADWLFENSTGIIPLSITELAEACGCGEATIVRFAKRLGFPGYQALTIAIAQEGRTSSVTSSVSGSGSCTDIFAKISNDIYCSLEKTRQNIDEASFKKAAEQIASSKNVYIFGLGNSSSIAIDAAHKFMRAGVSAVSYCDNHMQAIAASHLSEGDTAIGISHSGSSKDIVEALEIAAGRGAETICITNHGKSPIVKKSSIALFTSSDETEYSILGLNSRIAALTIIDTLYACIINSRGSEAASAITRVESALKDKKY